MTVSKLPDARTRRPSVQSYLNRIRASDEDRAAVKELRQDLTLAFLLLREIVTEHGLTEQPTALEIVQCAEMIRNRRASDNLENEAVPTKEEEPPFTEDDEEKLFTPF